MADARPGGFAQGVAEGFASAFLPEALVYDFAAGVIVPGEVVVGGLLLILGLFTRWALFGGALLMTALVFGTAHRKGMTHKGPLRQEWGTLFTQMIYAAVYYGLHLFVGRNRFSLDAAWRGRRS